MNGEISDIRKMRLGLRFYSFHKHLFNIYNVPAWTPETKFKLLTAWGRRQV
jgi:hypothetical protein